VVWINPDAIYGVDIGTGSGGDENEDRQARQPSAERQSFPGVTSDFQSNLVAANSLRRLRSSKQRSSLQVRLDTRQAIVVRLIQHLLSQRSALCPLMTNSRATHRIDDLVGGRTGHSESSQADFVAKTRRVRGRS